MGSIALYHDGTLLLRQRLGTSEVTIGTSPDNDIVLGGRQAKDDRMIISRDSSGRWRAALGDERSPAPLEGKDGKTAFRIGRYTVELAGLNDEAKRPKRRGAPEPAREDGEMVGDSAQLRELRFRISKVAPLRAPVLVTGETGTGKELVARALHRESGRPAERFVAVNCGGLARTMLEDILFGHERGAFTGAGATHRGVFERASGGTLFLDEIGELPLEQQASLLRVLDTGVVSRLGSEREERVSFRLVSATNQSLKSMVSDGRFRLDLYHRLGAITLKTPPLRDRTGDIAAMAQRFLADFEPDLGAKTLCDDALAVLADHSWPGNARELRNVLYQAAIASGGETIQARHLRIERPCCAAKRVAPRLCRLDDDLLVEVLNDNRGNVTAAARVLGVPRTTLRDRVRKMVDAA